MKKTLVALMALAGIAMGSTGTFSWTNSTAAPTFNTTGSITLTDMTVTLSDSSIESIRKPTNYNSGTLTPAINIGNSLSNSWTLDFTMENTSTEKSEHVSGMSFDMFLFNGQGNNQSGDAYDRSITLTLTSGGVEVGKVDLALSGDNNDYDTSSYVGKNSSATATITFSEDFTLAAGATKDFSLTITNAQTDCDAKTDGVQTRGTFVGMKGATIIPEPATATLSLLALCGLAARRRRK